MSTKRETLLDVHGMSCPSCIRHVNEALRAVDGISGVEVRLSDGKVLVQHDASTSVDSLREALQNAGYEASLSAAA